MKPELSRKLDEELRAKQKKEQSQPKALQVERPIEMSADTFLKKKLYKENAETVGVYSMSTVCVLWGTIIEAMEEYAQQSPTELRKELIEFCKTIDKDFILNEKYYNSKITDFLSTRPDSKGASDIKDKVRCSKCGELIGNCDLSCYYKDEEG